MSSTRHLRFCQSIYRDSKWIRAANTTKKICPVRLRNDEPIKPGPKSYGEILPATPLMNGNSGTVTLYRIGKIHENTQIFASYSYILAFPQCSLRTNLQHLATPLLVLSSLGATWFFEGESLWAKLLGGELGSLSWMLARGKSEALKLGIFKAMVVNRCWEGGDTLAPLKINKCTLKRDHFKRKCRTHHQFSGIL